LPRNARMHRRVTEGAWRILRCLRSTDCLLFLVALPCPLVCQMSGRHEGQMPADLARELLGSEFICCALTWLLQGCIVTSTWHYFHNSRAKQDARWLRMMVGGLFCTSMVVALLNTTALYRTFVVHRDVPYFLDSFVLSWHVNGVSSRPQ
jgi:hypothetical protein